MAVCVRGFVSFHQVSEMPAGCHDVIMYVKEESDLLLEELATTAFRFNAENLSHLDPEFSVPTDTYTRGDIESRHDPTIYTEKTPLRR